MKNCRKECKILHINDGSAKVMLNKNFHFMEEYHWAEQILETYLDQGFVIRQMIPNFTPSRGTPGSYAFYDTGFVVILERELEPGELVYDDNDWLEALDPEGLDRPENHVDNLEEELEMKDFEDDLELDDLEEDFDESFDMESDV